MKIVKKNVYYCDFCGKKGLSAGHMKNHEKHCTANPNRECGMCQELDNTQRDLPALIKKYKSRYTLLTQGESKKVQWMGKPITIDEIKEDVENCPMCILTIFRCAGLNRYYFSQIGLTYNYKEEMAELWKDINRDKYVGEY